MIKLLGFIGLTLLIIISCGSSEKNSQVTLKAIELSWNLPFIDKEKGGLAFEMRDSCIIYYSGDMVLYRLPYIFATLNKNAVHGNTTIISDDPKTMSYREVRYRNFIYRASNQTGIKYDSIKATEYTPFKVDSFLRNEAFKESNFYDLKNDSLVESIKDKKSSILFEKYIPKIKIDESYCDSTYLYFTNEIKNVDYSFSKVADSTKRMKLFQVKFIYNAIPKGTKGYKVDIARRELLFKIKEVKINNTKEILAFFERFKKDSKRLGLK